MKRSIEPSELFVSAADAERQPVAVVPYDAHSLEVSLRLSRLELIPMDNIAARDLLWRAVIAPDGWGRYRTTARYRLSVLFMLGKTDDGLGVRLNVAVDREPSRRPPGDTGPDSVAHRCEAVLARVPVEGGYRLEPLHRGYGYGDFRDVATYTRADDLMTPILIAVDCLATLPATRKPS